MGSTRINDLPHEMILEILSYISVEELLLSMQYVCGKWKYILEDVNLWSKVTFMPDNCISNFDMFRMLKNIPELRNFSSRRLIITSNVPAVENFTPVYFGNNIIAGSQHITEFLSHHCRNIKKLHFHHSQIFTSRQVEKIIDSFPRLESLSINLGGNSSNITQSVRLISCAHRLNALAFRRSYPEIPGLFKILADGCSSLKHLKLGSLQENNTISTEDLSYILQQKKHALETLVFACKQITGNALHLLKECKCLRNLHCIINTTNAPNGLWSIGQIESLTSFSLRNFEDKSKMLQSMFPTSRLTNLQKLHLSYYMFSGNNILIASVFEKCLNLTDLILEGHSNEKLGKELQCIANVKNLRRFHLSGCRQFTDDAVECISKCEKLNYLGLVGCKSLTDKSVEYLTNNHQLQRIVLDYSHGITGKNLSVMVGNQKHLCYLSLQHCPTVDPNNIQQLKVDFPTLCVYYCE